jgi:hypothetical protein
MATIKWPACMRGWTSISITEPLYHQAFLETGQVPALGSVSEESVAESNDTQSPWIWVYTRANCEVTVGIRCHAGPREDVVEKDRQTWLELLPLVRS